jgi:Carboxypeptidase regulatory-like domain/TonB-dependent Receptor Plug Domain
MRSVLRLFVIVTITVLGTLLATPMAAQFGQSTGGIHGKVVDEQGGLLTGVTVTVKGPGAASTVATDGLGEFHVINLPPGIYTIVLAREGFADVSRENVTVALGRDTELTITMQLSAVTAMITVSDEAPVIDTRRVATGAAVSQQELRDIPTARTPFVILATIPGIQVEGVNVAGAESNTQPTLTSKGSHGATFQVDGINMTDMGGAEGASVYFDFDSFQEMQVVTGGSDPSIRGSNAHLNMITKRGTNVFHGSARLFAVDERFGSDNLPSEAVAQGLDSGNRVVSIEDWGGEAGGPIWKDHIWLWGAYGRNQINLLTAGVGGRHDSRIEDFNAKLSGQTFPSNSVEIWYLRSNKLNFGRLAGPTHPPPTTWDQTLPQNTWKLEDSQVFSANLFASVQYGGANGDFTLTPKGGLSKQTFVDEEGVWSNTYGFYTSPSSQRQVKADSSYFFNTGRLGHELKVGFTYLKAFIGSTIVWPGDGSGGLAAQTWGSYYDCVDAEENPIGCAVITRSSSIGTETKYWGAYLGDTITMARLTANLGVRWDEQYGINRPSVAPGNPTFPEILPTLVYPGRPRDYTWKDWQPRFGVTYAVGSRRNTVFKASYSRYTEVLGIFQVSIPNNTTAAYAYYAWNDANHDNLVQRGEVDTSAGGFQRGRDYNPQAPGNALLPFNLVDSDLRAPKTDEIIIGIEHELLPAFTVGINYAHRKFTGNVYGPLNTFDPNTGYRFSRSDYEQYATLTGTTPDGVAYSEPVYRIKESVLDGLGLCTHDEEGGLICQAPAGSFFENRRDFRTTYDGAELVLTKRLTNRWMARGSLVYNDNRQHIDGPRACTDPTNLLLIFGLGNAQTCRNGDLVAVRGGNKDAVFLNSRWQVNLLGQYQLPMGFAVAANVYGRQGYPINWYRQAPESGTDGLSRDVVVVPAGASRYENVFELDMRLEKTIKIASTATATLSADLFNVTNENTVLQRQNRLEVGNTNEIREIQSPRIWRFGARIAF